MQVQMTNNAHASIHLTNPGVIWDGNGFMPVEVEIENHVSEARTWSLEFVSGAVRFGPYSADGGLRSRFQFTVGADATLDTVVFVPGPGPTGRDYSVNLQGVVSGPGVDQSRFSWLSTNQLARSYVAVSAGLEADARTFFGAPVGRLAGSYSSGPGRIRGDIELGVVDPGRWPADWRSWSPYSVVVLGADEFAALDAARRTALREWVALGGLLVLSPARPQPGAGVENAGLGRIISLPQSLGGINGDLAEADRKAEAAYQAALTAYRAAMTAVRNSRRGRGAAAASAPAPPIGPPPPMPTPPTRLEPPPGLLDHLPLADGTTVSLNLAEPPPRNPGPWTGQFRLVTSNDLYNWRVEKNPLVLVIGLLLFALLVGPVNFFVFAPPGRRHRLFVTVPALSLLASLGLGAGIVLGDGFGGDGARRALVMLLPWENKAAVFQEQVARTGVLLGAGFPLAADTAAGEVPDDDPGANAGRGDNAPPLNRTDTAAGGDWFRSHSRQVQRFWRITPTRARIELVGGGTGGAAPVVQSSLTTTLRDFVYLDAAGGVWAVDTLPPGRRVTLQTDARPWPQHRVAASMGTPPAPSPQELEYDQVAKRAAAGGMLTEKMKQILAGGPPDPTSATTDSGTDTRERGHFYALGGAGDLAPLDTLPSIRWTDESIIYTGRLEAARTP